MILDSQLLFSNSQTLTGTTNGTTSSVINLTVHEDLGIGDGEAVPKAVVTFTAGVTSSTATFNLSIQFQGSTDSTNWTTYVETPATTTASFGTGKVYQIRWPKRTPGAALPQYVRLNYAGTGATTATISSGTVYAAIALDADDGADTLGQYPGGFTAIA